MKTRTFLVLCVVLSVLQAGALLLIPSYSDVIEQLMLWFLSSNAR